MNSSEKISQRVELIRSKVPEYLDEGSEYNHRVIDKAERALLESGLYAKGTSKINPSSVTNLIMRAKGKNIYKTCRRTNGVRKYKNTKNGPYRD